MPFFVFLDCVPRRSIVELGGVAFRLSDVSCLPGANPEPVLEISPSPFIGARPPCMSSVCILFLVSRLSFVGSSADVNFCNPENIFVRTSTVCIDRSFTECRVAERMRTMNCVNILPCIIYHRISLQSLLSLVSFIGFMSSRRRCCSGTIIIMCDSYAIMVHLCNLKRRNNIRT